MWKRSILTKIFQTGSTHQLGENDSILCTRDTLPPKQKRILLLKIGAGPQSRKVYLLTPSIFEGTFGSFAGDVYLQNSKSSIQNTKINKTRVE